MGAYGYDVSIRFVRDWHEADPVTASDHREQAVRLLREASRTSGDSANQYIAAAQVQAILALTAPTTIADPVTEISTGDPGTSTQRPGHHRGLWSLARGRRRAAAEDGGA
jgi:hypothetical protein